MKTKRELIVSWKGWALTIPAGTAVDTGQGGHGSYAIAARPAFLAESLRPIATPIRSMFNHDATHYWVWVDVKDCEP